MYCAISAPRWPAQGPYSACGVYASCPNMPYQTQLRPVCFLTGNEASMPVWAGLSTALSCSEIGSFLLLSLARHCAKTLRSPDQPPLLVRPRQATKPASTHFNARQAFPHCNRPSVVPPHRGCALGMNAAVLGEPVAPVARELWDENQDLAFASLHNPFVRALADGSLPW